MPNPPRTAPTDGAEARTGDGRRPWPPGPSRRGALLAGVALAAVAALVAAVATGLAGRGGGGSEAGVFDDPGLVHVHALAVNQGDGVLYAATHTGLFRVEDGRAQRVGDRYQDTMGFTVAGPDRFVGSGHPDLRDRELRAPGKPPLLGFIESTDRGRSWQARSLLGEADLHAIAVAEDLIIGYDSTGQRVLASTDGRRWETRGVVTLLAMAADPSDAARLAGITEAGRLTASSDGGRTWADVADAPAELTALAWGGDGLLAGDRAGGLHRAAPDSTGWAVVARLGGAVEAIAPPAGSGPLHVAVAGVGILASGDAGRTWTTVYAPPRP